MSWAVLVGPALAFYLTPLGAYQRPQQQIPVGERRVINMVCMGVGSPTVILSAGADGWSLDWFRVRVRYQRQRGCARGIVQGTASAAAAQRCKTFSTRKQISILRA